MLTTWFYAIIYGLIWTLTRLLPISTTPILDERILGFFSWIGLGYKFFNEFIALDTLLWCASIGIGVELFILGFNLSVWILKRSHLLG